MFGLPGEDMPETSESNLVADGVDPEVEPSTDEVELSAAPTMPVISSVRVPDRDVYLTSILKRSLFDSTKVDLGMVGRPAGVGVEGGIVDDPETDLNVKLIGTLVADNRAFSSALILEDTPNARALGYAEGDTLLGSTVVTIEDKRVKIRRSDGRIEVIMAEGASEKPKPTTVAEAAEAPSEGGIEKVSDTEFIVPRDLLDKQLADLEGLSQMGRALLHRGPDGEFDGYRLSAIRRGSLPDQLGIRNGDVIHAVNDMPLSSVQGAMTAFQTLQNENGFSFEVTRRGQTVSMGYQVK
jgi:type II secretion system protein C